MENSKLSVRQIANKVRNYLAQNNCNLIVTVKGDSIIINNIANNFMCDCAQLCEHVTGQKMQRIYDSTARLI